jgi:hypothetical protein
MSNTTEEQPQGLDDKFFERADEYINLANNHINSSI